MIDRLWERNVIGAPKPFQSLGALRTLNIAAVGLALAAVTAGIFGLAGLIVGGSGRFGMATFVTGLPTLLIGVTWASLLRWRKTIGRSTVRWAWLLSVPLAMTNAGLAAGILYARYGHHLGWEQGLDGFALGFVLGCTFGAFAWLPVLTSVQKRGEMSAPVVRPSRAPGALLGVTSLACSSRSPC